MSLKKIDPDDRPDILKKCTRYMVRMCYSCFKSNKITLHGFKNPPSVPCKYCGASIPISKVPKSKITYK